MKCAYSKQKNMLVITDYVDGSLKLLNCNTNTVETIRNVKIKKPGAIYIDNDENVFINEYNSKFISILAFDSKFNFVFEFELFGWNRAFSLTMDENHKDKLLYVSSPLDKIGIWNSSNGSYIKSISIKSPYGMHFNGDKLFVTSLMNYETDQDDRISKITSGVSCIFVLNKDTHKMLQKIENQNFLNPIGLYFSNSSTFLTIARFLDSDGVLFKNRFLFKLDLNGKILQKIELKGVSSTKYSLNHLMFFEDKIIILYDTSIALIEIKSFL